MVITNLQQKQNRKIWVPIRGGNRGGWSLFNWQDVRDKPYKQRQMYLGNSATLGVLDRGGKWRKRDWYMKTDKRYHSDNLKSQQEEVIRKDYERMHAALNMQDKEDEEKLTEQQMRQLMKKIKMKKQGMQGMQMPPAPEAVGLGFDKMKVQIRAKPSAKMQNPHRLEAIDDFEAQKQQKKQKHQFKQQKKQKQKKQKKHKQEKDRKRDGSQQSSHKKKKKKQKHHKRQKQQKRQQKRQRSRQKQQKSHKKKQDKHDRHRDRSRSHEQKRKRRRHSSSSESR